MNNNDLMNALSGLDPKYIDEAAFELHDSMKPKKDANRARIRRIVYVTIPAAAAIFITLVAVIPAMMRLGKSSSSAPAAMSDSAEYAPAEEAAEDTGAAYEAEEAPADAAMSDSAPEAAEEYEYAAEAEAEAAAEAVEDAQSFGAADIADSAKSAEEAEEASFMLDKADHADGILTIEIKGALPDPPEGLEYTIKGKDGDGRAKTFSEGTLGDIMTGTEPLTLDISDLKLDKGTYTLTIAGESIEFTL